MADKDKPIEGVKLISHRARGVDLPDDPSHPYKLEMRFRPPALMDVAFLFQSGGSTEDVVIRAMTLEGLNEFIDHPKNRFRQHGRLQSLTITGPEGEVEKFEPRRSSVL